MFSTLKIDTIVFTLRRRNTYQSCHLNFLADYFEIFVFLNQYLENYESYYEKLFVPLSVCSYPLSVVENGGEYQV